MLMKLKWFLALVIMKQEKTRRAKKRIASLRKPELDVNSVIFLKLT